MFNCMYRDNLSVMANLAEIAAQGSQDEQERANYMADAEHYRGLANEVDQAILKEMWFETEGEAGLLLALQPDGPIREVSVSNLFALTLPGLNEDQLESSLGLLEKYFITQDTQLPIPSVPPINPIDGKLNPNYDPNHGEWDRLWRGSTWINMNWYLVERGIDMQAERADMAHRPDLISRCQNLIQFISERSYKVVAGVGLWECYGPEDTRPHRANRSPTFAWSALAYLLKDKYLVETKDLTQSA